MIKTKKSIKSIMIHTVAIFQSAIFMIPALWLIISAFKKGSELFTFPLVLIPKEPTLENFVSVLTKMDFITYTFNTLFVSVSATILTIIFSTMCGYALAKYRYRWMNIVFIMLLSTTMLPTEVLMAPSFVIILKLGLYNKLAGLIIPTLSTLTGVFMLRQFFITVPDELIEAARIDGASELIIFIRLMVPFSIPTNAILAIFSFRWRWNDYIWPLIVIDDPKKYTLQLALRNLVGEMSIDWSSLLAASVLSIIPIILIFIVFQRFIMGGSIGSGLKG